MANVQYRLSNKSIGDKSEVMMRFYAGRGLDQRARTHVYVPTAMWNDRKQRVMSSQRYGNVENIDVSELQDRLDYIEREVMERFVTDPSALRAGWLQATIDDITGRSAIDARHITLIDAITESANSSNAITTKKGYISLANNVASFCQEVCHGEKLLLRDVNAAMLCQISDYLRLDHSPNTVAGKLRRMRAVFNRAIHQGYINTNPFCPNGMHVPAERYATPTFLTIPERDSIYALTDLHPRLAAQRDIFIFQCHTGMRVGDMICLTKDNIDGNYLQYVPIKTRQETVETVRVPLSDVAMEIIHRYEGGKKLLPFITPQKYNEAIHRLVRMAGIDRQVMVLEPGTGTPVPRPLYEVASSHIARRTFAANVYKVTKDQRLTSSMTGHAPNSRSFLRYTVVDDDMKSEVIAMVDKK